LTGVDECWFDIVYCVGVWECWGSEKTTAVVRGSCDAFELTRTACLMSRVHQSHRDQIRWLTGRRDQARLWRVLVVRAVRHRWAAPVATAKGYNKIWIEERRPSRQLSTRNWVSTSWVYYESMDHSVGREQQMETMVNGRRSGGALRVRVGEAELSWESFGARKADMGVK
jgi:hypothetical protein